MSTWTRKIRLGTTEFNGNTITEVGISEDTTAKSILMRYLKDSNGDPVAIEEKQHHVHRYFLHGLCNII